MRSFRCYDNSDVIGTLLIKKFSSLSNTAVVIATYFTLKLGKYWPWKTYQDGNINEYYYRTLNATEIGLFGEFWAFRTSQNYSQAAITFQVVSHILFLLLDLKSFKYIVFFLSDVLFRWWRDRERGSRARQDSIQCSFIIQYLHTIVVQRRYNPL